MLESRDSWVPTAVPSHIRLTTATIAMMRVSWTLYSLTSLCSRRRRLRNINIKNTSVDPKQFTVSKFRLKPVTLISECFCSRCGHTNHPPPPTWRETTGDNGRQDHFRAQEADHTSQHEHRRSPASFLAVRTVFHTCIYWWKKGQTKLLPGWQGTGKREFPLLVLLRPLPQNIFGFPESLKSAEPEIRW